VDFTQIAEVRADMVFVETGAILNVEVVAGHDLTRRGANRPLKQPLRWSSSLASPVTMVTI
jgi:hypothetical protein